MSQPPRDQNDGKPPSPVEAFALVGAFGVSYAVADYSSGARHGVRSALVAFLVTVILAIIERAVRGRRRLSSPEYAFIVILVLGAAVGWAYAASTNKVTPPPTQTETKAQTDTNTHTDTTSHRKSQSTAKLPVRYIQDLPSISISSAVTTGVVDVDGRDYKDGVAIDTLASPHEIVVSVPKGYRSFRTILGVDSTTVDGSSGSFLVKVLGARGANAQDLSRVLAQTTVTSSPPPCRLDVPLDGMRTLGLTAEFADGEPMTVTFGEARVVDGRDIPRAPSAPACPS